MLFKTSLPVRPLTINIKSLAGRPACSAAHEIFTSSPPGFTFTYRQPELKREISILKMRDSAKPSTATSRRAFLELSGQLLLGGAALTLSPLSLGADSIAALQFKMLDPADVRLLTQACRLLFPHDSLAQSVYLDAVKELDARSGGDKEKAALIGQAVEFLQGQTNGAWERAGLE